MLFDLDCVLCFWSGFDLVLGLLFCFWLFVPCKKHGLWLIVSIWLAVFVVWCWLFCKFGLFVRVVCICFVFILLLINCCSLVVLVLVVCFVCCAVIVVWLWWWFGWLMIGVCIVLLVCLWLMICVDLLVLLALRVYLFGLVVWVVCLAFGVWMFWLIVAFSVLRTDWWLTLVLEIWCLVLAIVVFDLLFVGLTWWTGACFVLGVCILGVRYILGDLAFCVRLMVLWFWYDVWYVWWISWLLWC